MSDTNAVVAIYDTHSDAEEAIDELKKSSFDVTKLSVVGKDYHTEEHVVGYYNAGDRIKYWGKMGAFWGGLWGLLVGAAFFWVPGVGPLLVAGPVAAWIIGGPGRSSRCGWTECTWRRPVQHGDPQGQHPAIRDRREGR